MGVPIRRTAEAVLHLRVLLPPFDGDFVLLPVEADADIRDDETVDVIVRVRSQHAVYHKADSHGQIGVHRELRLAGIVIAVTAVVAGAEISSNVAVPLRRAVYAHGGAVHQRKARHMVLDGLAVALAHVRDGSTVQEGHVGIAPTVLC